MMHEHKAAHSNLVCKKLICHSALLCRGLLPKVTIIGDELSKAKLIVFGIADIMRI